MLLNFKNFFKPPVQLEVDPMEVSRRIFVKTVEGAKERYLKSLSIYETAFDQLMYDEAEKEKYIEECHKEMIAKRDEYYHLLRCAKDCKIQGEWIDTPKAIHVLYTNAKVKNIS